MIIVIGGSSYIGSHLCSHFKSKNQLSTATYYKTPVKGMQFFDLKQPDIKYLDLDFDEVKYAVICSAMSKVDECRKKKDLSESINVVGMKSLINQLFSMNIKPIFFSSDQVFDGKKGTYVEEDIKKPVNVYGMQKKTIEDFLLHSDKPFMISRISKIFGLKKGDSTLLTSWVEDLLDDKVLHCAVDQVLSFTWVFDIVRSIEISIQKDLNGCYNICNPEPLSRFDLARLIQSELNIKTGKILPCSINDFSFADPRGFNTSLDPSKFISETGFSFTSMDECLNELKKVYDL